MSKVPEDRVDQLNRCRTLAEKLQKELRELGGVCRDPSLYQADELLVMEKFHTLGMMRGIFQFIDWCEIEFGNMHEPSELAKRFHELYEQLAPEYGYETRKESAKPWEEVPEKNRRLMTAVCSEILKELKQ